MTWDEFAAVIGDEELAERIRMRCAGEQLEFPTRKPVFVMVRTVKAELRLKKTYAEIAVTHGLSEQTVRNYEKWRMQEDRLISPNGKEYKTGRG